VKQDRAADKGVPQCTFASTDAFSSALWPWR